MTVSKCPDCQAPLWLRACKCGWQAPVLAELKFSDRSPNAQAAYARQAAFYARHFRESRPARDPFRPIGTTAHRQIEEVSSWENSE